MIITSQGIVTLFKSSRPAKSPNQTKPKQTKTKQNITMKMKNKRVTEW